MLLRFVYDEKKIKKRERAIRLPNNRSCRQITVLVGLAPNGPTGARTPDPMIKSHLLYQLSYRSLLKVLVYSII